MQHYRHEDCTACKAGCLHFRQAILNVNPVLSTAFRAAMNAESAVEMLSGTFHTDLDLQWLQQIIDCDLFMRPMVQMGPGMA